MSGTVLVADDDDMIRESLGWVLEDEGYTVHKAPDGMPALKQLYSGREPMVVLLDLNMPLTDGLEVIKAIEAANPQVSRHVVIIITAQYGHLPLDLRKRLIDLAIPVFGKPFDLDKLLEAVAYASQRLQARDTQAS